MPRDAAARAGEHMSADLARAQASLVADLLEDRVPRGFDARGIHATAAVLRRKRDKHRHNEARAGFRIRRALFALLRSLRGR